MSEELLKAIEGVKYNPAAIQRVILDHLEQVNENGIDIVDPTNPFVFLLEASAVNASAAMQQAETLTRKQYPSLAQSIDDLYLHMSDVEYLGRFSQPARTTFKLLMGLEEFKASAVESDDGSSRKIVIPQHTEFAVAGYKFTLHYPIEMRVMSHGGIQIVYNSSEENPLKALESNVVDWTVIQIGEVEYIQLDIPISQYQITPHYDQLNAGTGFNKTFAFDDEFYHCRAYVTNAMGEWEEILTTHTEQVYDPTQLTATLKVLDGEVEIRIPQIYFTNGLADTDIRFDIHTTKGPLNLILSNYTPSSFSAVWKDLNSNGDEKHTAPLATFTTMAIYSDQTVTGGTSAVDFDTLRERVMTNSLGTSNLPITGFQLDTALNKLGYDIKKDIDNITRRVYLAVRDLPVPDDGVSFVAAGCGIFTVQNNMEHLGKLRSVKDNGNRMTVTPDTLYRLNEGLVEIVSETTQDEIDALPVDLKANHVNQEQYLYSPFHYVLDDDDNLFDLRAYYLDAPVVDSKVFVQENQTLEIEVSIDSYFIEKHSDGYKLTIMTRSGPTYKALEVDRCFVQMSYVPTNEASRAYLNGTYLGEVDGERIYEFDLASQFDVDSGDNLHLTSFKFYDSTTRELGIPLDGTLDVIFGVLDYTAVDVKPSEIDLKIGGYLLDGTVPSGIVHERLRVNFGQAMGNLWTKSRSLVDSQSYVTYATDVPWLYEERVYERDPVTGNIVVNQDGATGAITFNVLHEVGDPVLDGDGVPMIKHAVGDVILDPDGNPIEEGARKILRQLDFFMVDGIYKYATEAGSVAYRESLSSVLVDWVDTDIKSISESMLEQTELYFYPKTTFGLVKVYVDEGILTEINSEQSFHVKYYMDQAAFNSLELRTPLTNLAIETLANGMGSKTVSVTEISSKLAAAAGNDVLSVEISGLGPNGDLSTVTLAEESGNLTLAKQVQPLPDGTLSVQENVTVEFIRHIG